MPAALHEALLLARRLRGRCRRSRWPIRVPDVAGVQPRSVGATVNREVAAAVDRRAGRIDDRVCSADPAGVAIDPRTCDGAVLQRDAGPLGLGRVLTEE